MSQYEVIETDKMYWDLVRLELVKRTGLQNVQIKRIMQGYVDVALEELRTHYTFRFAHIALIYAPDATYQEEPYTLAYSALKVANKVGLPYNTVKGVITALVELVEVNLRQGKDFNLIKILQLKSQIDTDSKQIKVYATLSKYIALSLGTIPYRLRTQVLASFRQTI